MTPNLMTPDATTPDPRRLPWRRRERGGHRGGHGLPLWTVPPALLGVMFLVLPLVGLLVNVPWTAVPVQLRAPDVRSALYLSLICPIGSTLIAIVLGVPIAWLLARGRFPGRGLVRGLVTLPMILPPVVGGVALLYAFGRGGLVGRWGYREFGISLPYTTLGVMVASAFVSMPFLVLAVEAGIVQTGVRYEEAAETLGAGRLMVLRRITLPMLAPSLGAGATLCWARALGELGATLTFAGNLSGTTQTTPLAVFIALQTRPQDAVVLSLVLFVLSLGALLALRGRRMVGNP